MKIDTAKAQPFVFRMHVDPARAAALGESRHGWLTVTLDPAELDERQRAVLARVIGATPSYEQAQLPVRYVGSSDRLPPMPAFGRIDADAVAEAIAYSERALDVMEQDRRAEAERRRREEEERKVRRDHRFGLIREAVLELPARAFVSAVGTAWYATEEVRGRLKAAFPTPYFDLNTDIVASLRGWARDRGDADLLLAMERVEAEAKAVREEREAREKAEATAKAEADRRQAEARARTLAAVVREHGDAGQRRRFDAGLLPEEEAMALARRVLLAPLDGLGLEPYRKLTKGDLDPDGDRYVTDVEFAVSPAGRLSAEHFDLVERAKAVFAGSRDMAEVRIDRHAVYGRASGENVQVDRFSLYVAVTRDGLTVSRRHAAPDMPTFEE